VIALQSAVARSNGFSLIRKVLSDAHGEDWHTVEWKDDVSWGEILLTPSVVYHKAVLSLIGRHDEAAKVDVKGISHITGGGIAENLRRTLKKSGCGAVLSDLFEPHDAIKDLITLGSVEIEEAYRTWNMGNGMLVIVSANDADASLELLQSAGIQAKVAGTITSDSEVTVHAFDGSKI
jgi:phosphoribosylformylglycinamidine cyclo-ligase